MTELQAELLLRQAARIEALNSHVSHLEAHRDSLIDRVEALEAALGPFLRHYENWMDRYPDETYVSTYPRHTYGELRAARAALAPEQDK